MVSAKPPSPAASLHFSSLVAFHTLFAWGRRVCPPLVVLLEHDRPEEIKHPKGKMSC